MSVQAEASNVLGATLCCPVCTEAYSAQAKDHHSTNDPGIDDECGMERAPQQPVVLIPCGHSLCHTCCSKVAQCPLCKRGIAHSVPNFALLSLLSPPHSTDTTPSPHDTSIEESPTPAWRHHPPALPSCAVGHACPHTDHLTHWCVALGGSVCASCAVGGACVGHSHDCLLPLTQAYTQQRTKQSQQHESSDMTQHRAEAQAVRRQLEALVVEESGPTAKALTQAAHKVKAHIDSNLQQAISALQSRASLLHAQVDSALAQQQQHSQDLTHKARALATALQAAPLPPPPSTQPHPMLEWLRSLNDQSGLAQALHEARALLTERGEGREGLHVELCPPSTRELCDGVVSCLGVVCDTALCASKSHLTCPPVLPLAHPPTPLPIQLVTVDYQGRQRHRPLPGIVKVRVWWEGGGEGEQEELQCSWDGSTHTYSLFYTPPRDLPTQVRVLHLCGGYEDKEGGAVVALGEPTLVRIERQCTGRAVGMLLEEGAVKRPMGVALVPSIGQHSTLVAVEEATARLLVLHVYEGSRPELELRAEVVGSSHCLQGAGLRDVAVAVNSTHTTCYTTDQIRRAIHVLSLSLSSPSGAYHFESTGQLQCIHQSQTYVPSGLALWQEEGERGLCLIVGDVSNAVVRILDAHNGHTRRSIGKGKLRRPSCVAVAYRACTSPLDEEGEGERGAKPLVFVGDQGLGCVLCLELRTGAVVWCYQPSPHWGHALCPTGLASDNHRLYVTDWATGTVLVFDRCSGVMVREFGGEEGESRGGARGVGGMVALGDGTILQAHTNQHNIQAYR